MKDKEPVVQVRWVHFKSGYCLPAGQAWAFLTVANVKHFQGLFVPKPRSEFTAKMCLSVVWLIDGLSSTCHTFSRCSLCRVFCYWTICWDVHRICTSDIDVKSRLPERLFSFPFIRFWCLRQDPSPLVWVFFFFFFFFFFTFCTMVVERHRRWKPYENSKEKLVNCATEVPRLYRVSIQSCRQNWRSPKVQSRSWEWIEVCNHLEYLYGTWLAHLFIFLMATKNSLKLFAQGFSYGLSESKKKTGKIITKLFKVITKSWGEK